VTSVCVDSLANFYAADMRMQCTYKFDPDGRHVGTFGAPGEGPGDLMFGVVAAMDARSRIHTTGMGGCVQIMDTEWNFIEEFSRENPDNVSRSIAVSSDGSVHIAAVDVVEQTAIDSYGGDHEYLGSYAETYGSGQRIDWRTEALFAGGYVAVGADDGRSRSLLAVYDEGLRLLATAEQEGIHAVVGRDRRDRVFFSVRDAAGPRLVRATLNY
jgi:hypothetical protein